jgi:hypothetical protein
MWTLNLHFTFVAATAANIVLSAICIGNTVQEWIGYF